MNFSSHFKSSNAAKISNITKILIKEHFREPTALIWAALAPCIMFSLLTLNNPDFSKPGYLSTAAWFYSYISANVAFFGFSFYLIGRRESGFIRSFIYQRNAMKLFLASHTLSYSLISIAYSTLFYLITKPLYGGYLIFELLYLTACFYTSYLVFSCIGIIIVALPIKFSTSSTLFSLISFLMLLSGYLGSIQDRGTQHLLTLINPLSLSTSLFYGTLSLPATFLATLIALLAGLYLTGRHFRTQPVWSRY